ncbi:MAG: putative toxin-antitoxin system toxin component, PIN family [Firmicutes bacterium]|nr:putative toxin-antitoxin system toxin component, PIN family [Bacillota bacterium]
MRILIDTNVIISALLFPESIPAKALARVFEFHRLVLCQNVIDELRIVFSRKFAHKLRVLDDFLKNSAFELIYTPSTIDPSYYRSIRDSTDLPILVSAILGDVDIIISGDKDFTATELDKPLILTPVDFVYTWAENKQDI